MMPDKEKVIKGLQIHADGNGYLCQFCLEEGCPYVESSIIFGKRNCDIEQMCHDALVLLKEREPVEPIRGEDMDSSSACWWFVCPSCRIAIDYQDRFCRHCGQALKWG